MNYSDLPIYIKKGNQGEKSFSNIYDPSGISNALYITNLSTTGESSFQYLKSNILRVSGATGNLAHLYYPRVSITGQDAKITLPNFRSLIFYNTNGTRMKDPSFPAEDLPPLYFTGYGTNNVDYGNFNKADRYLRLRWDRPSDRYDLTYQTGVIPVTVSLLNALTTGFSSGWRIGAGTTPTGVFCSGFRPTAQNIIDCVNYPTGQSLYYTGYTGAPYYLPNSYQLDAAKLTGVVRADASGIVTGYVYPHTTLNLGSSYAYLLAQNASVDLEAQNNPIRNLGASVDRSNQFSHAGAMQTKISFNSYVNSEFSEGVKTILESSGKDPCSILIGSKVFDDCYLENYVVSVEPFKPVTIRANYMSNKDPEST
jgi:hypothetical protein